MNKLFVSLTCLLFSFFSSAHNGEDPLKELSKNKSRLSIVQNEFEQLDSRNAQFKSLQRQANYLQSNILILRRLMAADYPHVKSNMSKYKLDYIEEFDNGLKEFKQTLEQLQESLKE